MGVAEHTAMTTLSLVGQDAVSLRELLSNPREDITRILLKDESDLGELQGIDLTLWTSLRTIDLSGARLTRFDVALPSNLEELSLRNNLLDAIPPSVFDAVGLKVLNLAGNKIRVLFGAFDALPHLEALYLGANGLVDIDPTAFECMPSLQTLYLGGNHLSSLPSSVGSLVSLRSLWAHDNSLSSLPESIVSLVSLERLFLHRNKLSSVPAELLTLRRLKSLSLRENPLVSRFADSYRPAAPSLFELAARKLLKSGMPIDTERIPPTIVSMLHTTRCCHACNSPVFSEAVSHIDFLDLCGAYHVPFFQYLCSGSCAEHVQSAALDPITRAARLRKVLLDRYNPEQSATVEALRSELSARSWDEEFD